MNRKFISNSNFILRKILNLKDNTDIIKEFIEVILNIKIENIRINPYLEILKNKLPKEENFGIVNVRVKTKEEEFNVYNARLISAAILKVYGSASLNSLAFLQL